MTENQIGFLVLFLICEAINILAVLVGLSDNEFSTKLQFFVALFIPLSMGYVMIRASARGIRNGWGHLR